MKTFKFDQISYLEANSITQCSVVLTVTLAFANLANFNQSYQVGKIHSLPGSRIRFQICPNNVFQVFQPKKSLNDNVSTCSLPLGLTADFLAWWREYVGSCLALLKVFLFAKVEGDRRLSPMYIFWPYATFFFNQV